MLPDDDRQCHEYQQRVEQDIPEVGKETAGVAGEVERQD
jgi:hypothetical protein